MCAINYVQVKTKKLLNQYYRNLWRMDIKDQ